MLPICVYQRLLAFSFRIQFFGVFVSWRFVFEFLLLLGRAIPKSVGRHCGERQDRQHGQFDQHRLVAVGAICLVVGLVLGGAIAWYGGDETAIGIGLDRKSVV